MVFQAVDNIAHFRKIGKAFKLPQHFHCFRHRFQVLFVQRSLCNAVFRIFVFIVFIFVHHNRSVITQLLAAHHLYIHLYGTFAYAFIDAFVFIKSIRASIYQIFQRPASIRITQTVINCFITD